MPDVAFTENIQRHVTCPPGTYDGDTVRSVLDAAFADNEAARSYVLDERGAVRRHMIIFLDGKPITDRAGLSDAVSSNSKIYVMQALSGG